MNDARNGCPEKAIEPIENLEQQTINHLAYMAWELIAIRVFCEKSENFSDILLEAYNDCFDRYRQMANG